MGFNMISKLLPFFIIFLLITSGVFGVLFMDNLAHSECPLFNVLGGSCSSDMNTLVLIAHHLAGFKSLSLSLVVSSLSIFLAFLFLDSLKAKPLILPWKKFSLRLKLGRYIRFNPLEDLISWISLLSRGDHLSFLLA